MTRDDMAKKLRAVAIGALKAGDDVAARSVFAALCALDAVESTAARPLTSTERSRARRQRLKATPDATECNVACNEESNVACNVAPVAVEGGKGGGLSLGIAGISSDSLGSDPEENTQNTPKPPRRTRAKQPECNAPSVAEVVDEQMQNMARERNWPNPFEAYEALQDNYLRRGIKACGLIGWKAALRQWLKRNLDNQPPWNATLQRENEAESLRIHRDRDAKRTAELSAAGILPGFGTAAPANEMPDFLATLQSVAQSKRGAA